MIYTFENWSRLFKYLFIWFWRMALLWWMTQNSAENFVVKPERLNKTWVENSIKLAASSVDLRSEGRHMEMEGRGFSGLYKNSSEELFLKTVMESPIGMPVPTMEMLGFKNVSQSFRTDSEELFKRWLTNGEASHYMIMLLCYLLFLFWFVSNIRSKQRISFLHVSLTYIFSFQISKEFLNFMTLTCVYLSTYTSWLWSAPLPKNYVKHHTHYNFRVSLSPWFLNCEHGNLICQIDSVFLYFAQVSYFMSLLADPYLLLLILFFILKRFFALK